MRLTRLFQHRFAAALIVGWGVLAAAATARAQPDASAPGRSARRPRLMQVAEVLAEAERVFQAARAKSENPRLRSIERLAAQAQAGEEIASLYGQRVWLEAIPRTIIDRGLVCFAPPPAASQPAPPGRRDSVSLHLLNVIVTLSQRHLIVLEMTDDRAERVEPGRLHYFTGRVARLRRIGPGRWEIWVRHSRVPPKIDRWPQTFPDYRGYVARREHP